MGRLDADAERASYEIERLLEGYEPAVSVWPCTCDDVYGPDGYSDLLDDLAAGRTTADEIRRYLEQADGKPSDADPYTCIMIRDDIDDFIAEAEAAAAQRCAD